MLTNMIVEEEFEIKEDEPWFDHQDLEHDLHLAAELGKTLLDRNRELEGGLKQMYATNQEQLQEIEHLSKQVELLRSVNDQHAKVYEQLDTMARDLEQSNDRLLVDNRNAQHKIQGLTDTVNDLQVQVDDLTRQVEELDGLTVEPGDQQQKPGSSRSQNQGSGRGRHGSGPCSLSASDDDAVCGGDCCANGEAEEEEVRKEEEYVMLVSSMQTLQAQLAEERACRESVEREADVLARECGELELRLAQLEGYQVRLQEAEAEVAELRELWRADGTRNLTTGAMLLPDAFLLLPERGARGCCHGGVSCCRNRLKRCSSERQLKVPDKETADRGDISFGADGGIGDMASSGDCCRHERSCLGRSEVVKQRGISLLNEVDAQYSALQVKYDALLRRCEGGGAQTQSHKAVQTPGVTSQKTSTTNISTLTTTTSTATDASSVACLSSAVAGTVAEAQLPEYKVLFHEIFKCIQKSKMDIEQNRAKPRSIE